MGNQEFVENHWNEQFDAFVDAKTQAAVDARLAPLGTEVDRPKASADDRSFEWIGNRWSDELFDGPFYLSPVPEGVAGVSLVFVQSRDGNTVAADPSQLGGGETDRHLIYEGLSRVAADAVLAGAETIRGGDIIFSAWHPGAVALRAALGLPRHPMQIVATLRGLDFAHALLLNVPAVPVTILTVAHVAAQIVPAVAERPWIRVITLPQPDELGPAFAELRTLGVRRVSTVGGRTVAGALLDAGLVQDLYLTTAPREGGEPGTPLYPRPLRRELVVRKHGTGDDEGVTFEHWRIGVARRL